MYKNLLIFLVIAFLPISEASASIFGGVVNRLPLSAAMIGASSKLSPVCNNASLPGGNGLSAGGQQIQWRKVYYCPQGATRIALMFTGFYADTSIPPAEADLVAPVPVNLAIETGVPAMWNSSTTYNAGDSVSWASTLAGSSYNLNPIYTALQTNTNSMPTPQNTKWSAGTTPTITPVTCNGGRTCTLQTTVTPAGTLVTKGILITDPIPVKVAVGSYIAVRGWINQSTGQKVALSQQQLPIMGSYYSAGSSKTDVTLSGAASGSPAYFGPTGIIGVPINKTPTVCIVGDSRTDGTASKGLTGFTLSSGGSGYQKGDLLTSPDSGGSAHAVGTPAQFIVTNTSAGVITSATIINTGYYNDPGINTGETLPNGTQNMLGGSGTGAQFSAYSFGVAIDYDSTLAPGFVSRGLTVAGIPWIGLTRSGDRASAWITRDYGRMAAAAASGCSSAIVELGFNDAGSGDSAATIKANLTTIGNQLVGIGVKPYVATMPPGATSSDGYLTLGNQTIESENTARVSVNDWERAVPTPYVGYFETADPVENGRNGGKWAVDGVTNCLYTCDGTHSTPAGYAASATGITANINILQ